MPTPAGQGEGEFLARARVDGERELPDPQLSRDRDGDCLLIEQPSPHMVHNRLQTLVADALTVDGGHVISGVAHDVIHGDLVAAFPPDGRESVP